MVEKMMTDAIKRLAAAIVYPDPVPADADRFTFLVDDGEVKAIVASGELRLERELPAGGEHAVRLAEFSAGRILREEATLAWDATAEKFFLWQAVPDTLSDERLKLFFEVFTASCDWWLDRLREESAPVTPLPELIILP